MPPQQVLADVIVRRGEKLPVEAALARGLQTDEDDHFAMRDVEVQPNPPPVALSIIVAVTDVSLTVARFVDGSSGGAGVLIRGRVGSWVRGVRGVGCVGMGRGTSVSICRGR